MNAAEKYRAKVKEKTFDLELPSGNTIKVILPPVQTWMAMGAVPPFYLKLVSQQWSGTPDDLQMQFSPAEMMEIIKGFCEIVCAACVEPRVIASGDPGEGELSILEIPPADRDTIVGWCMAGGPGLGVPLKTGEVQPEKLAHFPDSSPVAATAPSGTRGEDIRM
jgi:hypothetical protein